MSNTLENNAPASEKGKGSSAPKLNMQMLSAQIADLQAKIDTLEKYRVPRIMREKAPADQQESQRRPRVALFRFGSCELQETTTRNFQDNIKLYAPIDGLFDPESKLGKAMVKLSQDYLDAGELNRLVGSNEMKTALTHLEQFFLGTFLRHGWKGVWKEAGPRKRLISIRPSEDWDGVKIPKDIKAKKNKKYYS